MAMPRDHADFDIHEEIALFLNHRERWLRVEGTSVTEAEENMALFCLRAKAILLTPCSARHDGKGIYVGRAASNPDVLTAAIVRNIVSAALLDETGLKRALKATGGNLQTMRSG